MNLKALALFSLSAAVLQADNLYSNFLVVNVDFAGAAQTFPLGINDSRLVAGYYQLTPSSLPHGFEWRDGVSSTIDVPFANAIGTTAASVDNKGNIVGNWFDTAGHIHGYLRTLPNGCASDQGPGCAPVFTSFDVNIPGSIFTTTVPFEGAAGFGTGSFGLNNNGDIVGLYATHDANGTYSNGFIRSGGTDTPVDLSFDHSDGNGTKFFGINDNGVAVGDIVFEPFPGLHITHGFLLSGGNATPINVAGADLGGFGTQVNGINNAGTVVGIYSDPSGTSGHGLVWTQATSANPNTFDVPGSPFTELHVINNLGDITGAYFTFDGQEHAIIAFTPEPATMLIAGLGLLGLGLLRKRS
jgi:hypothetical protein